MKHLILYTNNPYKMQLKPIFYRKYIVIKYQCYLRHACLNCISIFLMRKVCFYSIIIDYWYRKTGNKEFNKGCVIHTENLYILNFTIVAVYFLNKLCYNIPDY